MGKPDFFIVGAPKSGTTALVSYLCQHPEIFFPDMSYSVEKILGGKREFHFFGSDLAFNRPSLDEYLSYYQNTGARSRFGEASVFYLYSKNAALEIKKFSPFADIIILLRNPIDVIYSWHSQLVLWGDETITDFEEALQLEPSRKIGLHIPSKHDHPIECYYYKEIGRFSTQVKRFFDIFPRKNIKIIIFDDFIHNTRVIFSDVLSFLNVDSTYCPSFHIVNSNKIVRNSSLQRILLKPPPLIKRIAKSLFPATSTYRARTAILRKNLKTIQRPPITPNLRERLQEDFTTEINCLSNLLERDLSIWISN